MTQRTLPSLFGAATALTAALALLAPARPAVGQMATTPADRWWQEGVVYQVYPRSFQDTDGNGVGDLRGITRRLDYLQWLGVDAIWISPFFPSPMRDFGYDVSDFTGVDSIFGTLTDFERLTTAAHTRGIRVILDFVGNHTSDRHAWFKASRRSRTDPKRDWYVWRDAAPGSGPPNNWLSIFGGSAWTLDSATKQYYYHQFLREQPDLNWRSPALRRAMYEAMRFWLARGADGFRLDAIPHFVEDSLFRDNPPNPGYRDGDGDRARHIWTHTFDQPLTHAIGCDMRRLTARFTARDGRARVLIGETGMDPARLMAYYGHNGCGLNMPTNFSLQGAPWRADTVAAKIAAYTSALAKTTPDATSAPASRWPNYVLGNHDTSRLASRLGPAAARAAAVLLLTLRGTPTIYYGDELGMHDVRIPPDLVQDPAEKEQPGRGFGRDPGRTPMQWEAARGGGFTTGNPWLPVADDVARVNVAGARQDSSSMLSLYHQLLALRRSERALSRGTFTLLPRQGDLLGYVREDADAGPTAGRFLIIVNFSHAPAVYALDAAAKSRLTDAGRRRAMVVAGTHHRGGAVELSRVSLAADEAIIVSLAPAK